MLNQKSEQSFLKNMDAAEASAAIAFIGENISEDGEICPDLDFLRHEEGFFVGQQVYERDTLAPGTIMDIDEDGIAEVLFTNGSTDGVSLEHLTISASEYCECGMSFGEGEHVCSTEEPEYDYEPDEYLFREDHPNLPRWPATGGIKTDTLAMLSILSSGIGGRSKNCEGKAGR